MIMRNRWCLAVLLGISRRERRARRGPGAVHGPRTEHLRPGHAPRDVPLVPGASRSRSRALPLPRSLSGRGAIPSSRRDVQLHLLGRGDELLLFRKPVHRPGFFDALDGRPAAPASPRSFPRVPLRRPGWPRRLPGRHWWPSVEELVGLGSLRRGAGPGRDWGRRRDPLAESIRGGAEARSSPRGPSPSPLFRRRRSSTSTGSPSDTFICGTSSSLLSERSTQRSPSSRREE